MTYTIHKTNLEPQPALVARRHIKPTEIAPALGEMFQQVAVYLQQHGIAPAGAPFAQYVTMGRDQWTIEAGFPVAAHAAAEGAVSSATLPGGPAAVTVHSGPYDQLPHAHIAVNEWLKAEALQPSGPPRESYITDPGALPNPQDWKTEVIFPLKS